VQRLEIVARACELIVRPNETPEDGKTTRTIEELMDEVIRRGIVPDISWSSVQRIIDAETAWYFDPGTYQVIVFDPTTMTTDGNTIDFSGMLEQDYNLTLGNVSRLDDSLVISAQYWDADWNSLSLTRAAIIDIESHEVSYTDDTRCGSTRSHAKDSAGNVYVGAHPGESLWGAAGLANEDAPKPCLIRIKSGGTEFDDEYYVNLEQASAGKVVGRFMQGQDNHAYVYVHGRHRRRHRR
jgi:hypothetical protein